MVKIDSVIALNVDNREETEISGSEQMQSNDQCKQENNEFYCQMQHIQYSFAANLLSCSEDYNRASAAVQSISSIQDVKNYQDVHLRR